MVLNLVRVKVRVRDQIELAAYLALVSFWSFWSTCSSNSLIANPWNPPLNLVIKLESVYSNRCTNQSASDRPSFSIFFRDLNIGQFWTETTFHRLLIRIAEIVFLFLFWFKSECSDWPSSYPFSHLLLRIWESSKLNCSLVPDPPLG